MRCNIQHDDLITQVDVALHVARRPGSPTASSRAASKGGPFEVAARRPVRCSAYL